MTHTPTQPSSGDKRANEYMAVIKTAIVGPDSETTVTVTQFKCRDQLIDMTLDLPDVCCMIQVLTKVRDILGLSA